jgi:hypothetical protein
VTRTLSAVLRAPCFLGALFTATVFGQSLPQTVTFFVLPDGNLAPGSESELIGAAAPPGGAAIPYSFDFTEDQRIDRNGYVVLARDPTNAQAFTVTDFLLRAKDPTLGATLTLSPSSSGPLGAWSTTDALGIFPAGATISATLNCDVAVDDPALAAALPTSDVLTLGGALVPGYFHQIVLLTASLAGIPSTSFTLFMKEDLHVPDITWVMTAKHGDASAVRAGAPASELLHGAFGIKRSASVRSDYELVAVGLDVDGAPPLGIVGGGVGGSGGSLSLDPSTRTVYGTLTLVVDGVLVTRTLDGVDDSYTGSPTMPTSINLNEPFLGSLDAFHFVGGRPGIHPKTNDFEVGLVTELSIRGRPGDLYYSACSFQPVPGVNTPIGDIFVSLDSMFLFSVDPNNGIVGNNIGYMGATGEAAVTVAIPNLPWLAGFTTFFAGVLLTNDPNLGGYAFTAVTNPHRATIR